MAVLRAFLLITFLLLAGCDSGEKQFGSPTTQLITPVASGSVAASATVTAVALTATPLPTLPVTPTQTTAASDLPIPTTPSAAINPPPGPLSGAALAEALRGGGYVIYFRHAATDLTPDDANPVILGDCSTQRNLSAAGKEQAGQIGQAFERFDILVGQVFASPFCRALDTARLAFGKVEIEPTLENLETAPDEAEREKRTTGLRRLLSTPPSPGTNTVLVAHGFNINAAAQITISEGEAAVFRPEGAGKFSLVATISLDTWEELAL